MAETLMCVKEIGKAGAHKCTWSSLEKSLTDNVSFAWCCQKLEEANKAFFYALPS